MARSAPIADAVRRGFVGRWRDVVHAVLERGVARGELRADADLALAIELIAGPLFHRFLVTGGAVDEALGLRLRITRGGAHPRFLSEGTGQA